MLYQKLLVGEHPYIVAVGGASAFGLHRHPEIELSYCMSGEYWVTIDSREYHLEEGDLLIVDPMAAHQFPKDCNDSAQRLTIELGPGLLGEHFEAFADMTPRVRVLRLHKEREQDELYPELARLLEETAQLHVRREEFFGLSIRGNLYKISALLLQLLSRSGSSAGPVQSLKDVEKIERSLEIIYNRYDENLDLETVSQVCGYSKSNFCKVFKRVTGDTFHQVLTRHRVEIARLHLKESAEPIERIASMVGIPDAKSFCRTFKRIMGETPGTYRKKSTRRKK